MIRGTNHWHTVKGPTEDKIASIRQLSTKHVGDTIAYSEQLPRQGNINIEY